MEPNVKDLIIFIDHVGRTCMGEVNAVFDSTIELKNPAILHVQPTQTGQLQVQTIPLFFKEFLTPEARNEGTLWMFQRNKIVLASQANVTEQLKNNYYGLFKAAATTATVAPSGEGKVIKLFE